MTVNGALEPTLRDYLRIIIRRKWFVLLPIVLVSTVSLAGTWAATPMYRATAEVLVRLPPTASSVSSTGAVMSPRMVENELETAQGSELRVLVRETVGAEPLLSVRSSSGSDVFAFSAVSADPNLAAAAANEYAERYIDRQRETLVAEFAARTAVLRAALAEAEEIDTGGDGTRVVELRSQLDDLRVSSQLAETSGARLIDRATAPGAPFEPKPIRTLTLGLIVGVLLGLGAAFAVDYLDRTIRDEDELVDLTGVPNLAAIPQVPGGRKEDDHVVVSRSDPGSTGAEAYRSLRTAVRFMSLEREMQLVQVTSSHPGEGKTTTATNLAYAASKSGQQVLLIDCDLRKPEVHNYLGLSNYKGFTSVLLGEARMHEVAQELAGSGGLLVITAGEVPPNPSELLAGDGVRKALAQVGSKFDLVVIDSPPVLAVSDPLVLSGLVDGVIVVVSGRTTDSRSVSRTMDRLAKVDGQVLGTVFNQSDVADAAAYETGYTQPIAATPRPRELEMSS